MGKFYEGLFDGLSLFVRHCAWLNAVPDKPEHDKSKTPEISRREKLKKGGIDDPEMPPCDAPHLIYYLFEIGPTLIDGMGHGPLTHAEILAWQSNSGVELDSWEARFLKRLSIEHLNESHRARKADAEAPWLEAPYVKPAPHRVALSLQASLRALAKL